ncbi:hypothetical protein GN958_ATG15989 [Phytophthora infestans]|uniref:M96 mating-specific protein family n=1 Tax=Phytophthora infestans TaxID=4787 RepID=A0A8S9U3B1_PHYIN|nr:hypothetical protein GN958_ATG15989 [Phytophthora infestans]
MDVPDLSFFMVPLQVPQSSVDVASTAITLLDDINAATTISAFTNPAATRKPKKKRSHTTPTRDRERRELLALRVESVELEKQLQQARDHLATVRKKRQEEIASRSSRIVSTVPAWRHIARRHLRARQEAEKENRRLREQLAEHLKWSNALQVKVSQRGGGEDENSTRAAATAAALGTVANLLLLAEDEEGITDLELELDDTDRAELDMLASGLDLAFARVDDVFKEHAVSGVPLGAVSGSRTILEGEQANEMSTVELRDTRVIPFDFKLAIDATWNAWVLWHLGGSCRKSVSAHRSCSYPDVSRPEHTFAVKFRLQTPASKLPPSTDPMFLDLKLVLRRYVEQNRLVLIWRGLSAGENDLDGLFTDETGWVVIERMAPFQRSLEGGGDTVTAAARTSMRSCVRMTPKRAADCEATSVQGRILTNLVVNSYEEDVSFIYREMEAQLLRLTRHV